MELWFSGKESRVDHLRDQLSGSLLGLVVGHRFGQLAFVDISHPDILLVCRLFISSIWCDGWTKIYWSQCRHMHLRRYHWWIL